MTAGIVDEQKPPLIVLVEADVAVGELPCQMIEILHRAWCIYLLGDIGAAFGVFAETALGFRGVGNAGDFAHDGNFQVKRVLSGCGYCMR